MKKSVTYGPGTTDSGQMSRLSVCLFLTLLQLSSSSPAPPPPQHPPPASGGGAYRHSPIIGTLESI